MKNEFFNDLKLALIAIFGFELVAFFCSFLLGGLIWMQHDFQKASKLFILLMILFQLIAAYFVIKSLLLSKKKRREWNAN